MLRLASTLLRRRSAAPALRSSLCTVTDKPSPEEAFKQLVKAAEAGDAASQCDVGFSFHQGTNPSGNKNVDIAMDLYQKAGAQGYSPAVSLLADIHYYDHDERKDWGLAEKYLKEVVELTDPKEPGDAYLRSKSLQKMGNIALRGYGEDLAFGKDRDAGLQHFRDSLSICAEHLGGSWAFLLSHDPPGLWELLEAESKLLADGETLSRVMTGLVSVDGGVGGDGVGGGGGALSQLQYYTRALRAKENDEEWVLKLQEDVLTRFPESSGAGDWGVTYFASYLRMFHHPAVQQAVTMGSKGLHGGGAVPKVLALGSALGNAVSWPALAFGFRGVGLDVLPACVEGSTALHAAAAAAVENTNKLLREYNKPGGDGAGVGEVTFDEVDVVADLARVRAECADSSVVWLNDYSWPEAAQAATEAAVMEALQPGAVLVLYRAPHHSPPRKDLSVKVPTSWNPGLDMHIRVARPPA